MRILAIACLCATAYAQQQPNVPAQREAMKKLAFLLGKWSGTGWVITGPGAPIQIQQSEDVQYKLDGLLLAIEGTGREPGSGNVTFRAFATISYDDATSKYRFRAYNDGRYLDTELTVVEKGFEWGMEGDRFTVKYTMQLNEKGEWVETGESVFGGGPPRKMLEMTLRKQ